MSTITSVDRSIVSEYTNCLLDCIQGVWKRIYEYACAFFAYLFGSAASELAREPVRLPLPVVTIISEYVFNAENHTELLHIIQGTTEKIVTMPPGPLDRGCRLGRPSVVQESFYELHFQMFPLVSRLITLKRLAECFDAPQLMDKIAQVFRRTYFLPLDANEGEYCWKKRSVGMQDLPQFVEGKNEHMSALHITPESGAFFPVLANLWKVTVPEAEQMVAAIKELLAVPELKAELNVNNTSKRQVVWVPKATLTIKTGK